MPPFVVTQTEREKQQQRNNRKESTRALFRESRLFVDPRKIVVYLVRLDCVSCACICDLFEGILTGIKLRQLEHPG